MVDTPEKIWIEQDDCPYFYVESELTEVGSPVTEYTRSDLVAELEAENEWLKQTLETANKRADEADGLQKMIDGVKEEATAEGRGFWKPCTGCHESEMGQTTLGGWSKMFSCEQGVGCLECGGLGVLWDSEDYGDMAEWMHQEDKKEAGRKAELTALRARVAELEEALRTIERHPIENFCMGRPDLGIPGYASCQDVARAALTSEGVNE